MVRIFDKYWIKTSIVEQMKQRARLYCEKGQFPLAPELGGMKIVDACQAQVEKPDLITLLIFTMDDGMHAIGWWKNPDFARCYHLSVSYWYPDGRTAPKNEKETAEWVRLFFQPNERWVWSEPSHSAIGKRRNVWHYRLFADEHWQPVYPQGEVYNTLKTERGWLSYSDLQDKLKREEQAILEQIN